jgi:hypothetical protein
VAYLVDNPAVAKEIEDKLRAMMLAKPRKTGSGGDVSKDKDEAVATAD